MLAARFGSSSEKAAGAAGAATASAETTAARAAAKPAAADVRYQAAADALLSGLAEQLQERQTALCIEDIETSVNPKP